MTQTLNKILYVEDEDDIRTIAQLALETVGGFVLKSCAGGAQALREGPDFAPDLILLDVMMPGMDGPSTLAALREHAALAEVPVIFMTAKVQQGEIAHYRALGSLDVIAKPFDPMTLADQVRAIWGRAHG